MVLPGIQGHSTYSSLIRSAIRFHSNGSTKNGGRDFMLLPWPLLGVDGQLLCLAVQDFLTRFLLDYLDRISLRAMCWHRNINDCAFSFPGCGTRFSLS